MNYWEQVYVYAMPPVGLIVCLFVFCFCFFSPPSALVS